MKRKKMEETFEEYKRKYNRNTDIGGILFGLALLPLFRPLGVVLIIAFASFLLNDRYLKR